MHWSQEKEYKGLYPYEKNKSQEVCVTDCYFTIAYMVLYFQGATGFPGSAGRVGPPGPAVSQFSNSNN